MDVVAARLRATKPATRRTSILHNDFKVDNCQFDPSDPDRVKSVFDWDMATLGDPLVDVGTMLNYWPDASDGDDRAVYPEGLDAFGLPGRDEVVARYAERVGDAVDDVWWYEALACFKTGVVLQQLYSRYARGETTDERQADKGSRVVSQARRAMTILERHPRGPA
jgi:aminoglycoside phosphotransferase (APT) family kinase protein